MALHPSAEMMVQVLNDSGLTFGPDATPEKRRAAMIAATTNPRFPKHPVHDVADRTIPGPAGDIPIRVFRYTECRPALPLLLWFHGGGWVTGNLDTHDQLGRLLADAVGAVVVSVDYRLAPEAKFPPRPTTASPRTSGRSPTPTKSVLIRHASRSAATARAGTSPRSSRSSRDGGLPAAAEAATPGVSRHRLRARQSRR